MSILGKNLPTQTYAVSLQKKTHTHTDTPLNFDNIQTFPQSLKL